MAWNNVSRIRQIVLSGALALMMVAAGVALVPAQPAAATTICICTGGWCPLGKVASTCGCVSHCAE